MIAFFDQLTLLRSALVTAGASSALIYGCARHGTVDPENEPVVCEAELRSWVVALRGRHMYLEIGCPIGYEHLNGRVEYTIASMRGDYERGADPAGGAKVARMTRGSWIFPPAGAPEPDHRLEARYEITVEQAICLQEDVMFREAYVLVGANSSSGLRAVMEGCGLELPAHVVASGGLFGAFPGVNASVGERMPAERWRMNGLPGGPVPVPRAEAEFGDE